MREIEPAPQQSFAQPAAADPQMMFHLQEKNPAIAAVLNLFVPGIGYMYCGRIGLGLVALFLIPLVVFLTHGIALLITVPVVVIDGVLCAQRYNRLLADRLLPGKQPLKSESPKA